MAISTDPYALVVDDDVLVRLDARGILEEAGFRCFEAKTGDAAKLLLGEMGARIILLFTDVQMPGSVDGFALARWTDAHWPEVEIVVASGGVTPSAGDLPDKASFIAKPFDSDVVHSHLARTLPDGKKPEPLKTAV